MKNLQLKPELKEKLKELGFIQVGADVDYADFVFAVEDKKLVWFSIAREFNGKIVYWFQNLIPLDGEDEWHDLDVEQTEQLIKNLILYKNWLKFFKEEITKINELLDLGMEEV